MGGQSIEVPFLLDTRGMPGVLKKELIVELDDEVGVHAVPVECEVISPSGMFAALRLGPVAAGEERQIALDVGPGPSGAEVRVKGVRSGSPALRWTSTKPKSFPAGRGALVNLKFTPFQGNPVPIEVLVDFELPAPVTQKITIEYENPLP